MPSYESLADLRLDDLVTLGPDDSLAHYGIKGQKWGIRRFQNSDGSLTAEGKLRYGDGITKEDKAALKKEYKKDNEDAFKYGKAATISARAASYASKKEEKASKAYARKPSDKNAKRLETATKLRQDWADEAKRLEKRANDHMKSLVKKYGESAVSSIRFDKKGRVDERIHTGKAYWVSYLATLGVTATSVALGLPVTMIFSPISKNKAAREAYRDSARDLEVIRKLATQS